MTLPDGDLVLVADDDADIRDLVEFKLTQAGYTVHAVGDGPYCCSALSHATATSTPASRWVRPTTSSSRSALAS